MQTIRKADGFEAEKLIVFPDALLEDISQHLLVKPIYVTDIGFFPRAQYHYRERPEGCNTAIFIYCVAGKKSHVFREAGISGKFGQSLSLSCCREDRGREEAPILSPYFSGK